MLGFETSDDAAVYRLTDDIAALLTVDFFTPIVDDPYDFGRIAAANSLSDIYAMGGRPLTAMNLLAFPCSLGADIVGEVVRGGAEKVAEAGAVTVAATPSTTRSRSSGSRCSASCIPTRSCATAARRPGDVIFLTKPIGTGIIGTALKHGLENEETARDCHRVDGDAEPRCVRSDGRGRRERGTDVTGFGLLGHLHEMAEASGVRPNSSRKVPLFDRVADYAEQGVVPGRTADVVAWADVRRLGGILDADAWMRILCDPQTSGGLLIAVAPSRRTRWRTRWPSAVLARAVWALHCRHPRRNHRPIAPRPAASRYNRC